MFSGGSTGNIGKKRVKQSGAIAEGLVDRENGKMYNGGVRMYKMMYEAIMRKAFDSIQTIHEADVEYNYLQTNLNIDNLNFESAWEDQILKEYYNDFLDAKEKMQAG